MKMKKLFKVNPTEGYYPPMDYIFFKKDDYILVFYGATQLNYSDTLSGRGKVLRWSKKINERVYYYFIDQIFPSKANFPGDLKEVHPAVLLTSAYEQFRKYAKKLLKEKWNACN